MKKSPTKHQTDRCPCDSGLAYTACCAPLHGGEPASDAMVLMRSRYSAYAMGLSEYLLASWHPRTRPADLDLHTAPQPKWLGLDIRRITQLDERRAEVEFIARGKANGRAFRLHEISRFEHDGVNWLYVDGDIQDDRPPSGGGNLSR